MLRVLLVSHAFPPTIGGVETHLWDLSKELALRGYMVHCLVGGDKICEKFGNISVKRCPELTVHYLLHQRQGSLKSAINLKLLEQLRLIINDVIQSVSPDVIHLHNAHHFAPELALAFFLHPKRIPLLNSVHDRIGEHLYPEVLQYPWKHVIFASQYLSDNLPKSEGLKSVLWIGINLEIFTPEGERDSKFTRLERPIIFHPSRLLRWKGVEVGLEIRNKIGTGSLILCGSTNIVDDPYDVSNLRQELIATARSANIESHVHFMEFDRSQMPLAYRASDLIWYPTIDEEALGLVPLEAMACGVPIIVSYSGGMKETVISGVTGKVVPKGDSLALAEAALDILGNRSLRQVLLASGLQRARNFDIKDYTTAIERIYHLSIGAKI
jgi:hypothetical protein